MLPVKNRLKLPTKWNRNYPDLQFRTPHFKMLVKKIAPPQECKLGFIISGKVGKATVRNRLRRLIEGFMRENLEKPLGLDIVLIVYPSASKATNEEINVSCDQTLSKIHLR